MAALGSLRSLRTPPFSTLEDSLLSVHGKTLPVFPTPFTPQWSKLSFCPLWCATGFLESWLLPLNSTRITGQELLGFEGGTDERVMLDQSASDTELHGIRLTGETTT